MSGIANTAIGEIAIKYNERAYLFRPDFYALHEISESFDITDLFKRLSFMYAVRDNEFAYSNNDIASCVCVLQACFKGKDLDSLFELTGAMEESTLHKGKILYRPGAIPVHDLIVLSYDLVKNTLIGKPKKKIEASKDENNVCIDATEFVGCAVAHLGISNDKAWQMTMIEFQRAMESKFPQELKERNVPTKSSYDKMVAKMKERGIH